MSNNLDVPNVKCMKWTLNRIHYYYKTLHTNLHYLMFLWDNVTMHTYQIQLIFVNIINPLWTP